MDLAETHIVTVNAGSSSIKLALFTAGDTPKQVLAARVENIGQSSTSLVVDNETTSGSNTTPVAATSHIAGAQILIDWLKRQTPEVTIAAIGHRVVHGGPKYYKPQIINSQMLADLRELKPFDPEHLPVEIQLIEEFQKLFPHAKQVACFDTAFHRSLPTQARLLPIPRHFETKGIRRYGFHGLSYAFILEELRRVEGRAAANGKVIIAHLGSGASLAALRDGKSIDTTMGMTPASGIPMSTRSGDLDPGMALYLSRSEGYNAEQFNNMVNFKSGLLGISETTADMKKLLEIEADDERAKDAIDIFCYQVKKSIGGLAAGLGGLNTLVFTGGMGEDAPKIRKRVCENLEFLGVTLDTARNQKNARLISTDGSRVGVHVIHTDEAMTIAREIVKLVKQH
jgi:acetate kinase